MSQIELKNNNLNKKTVNKYNIDRPKCKIDLIYFTSYTFYYYIICVIQLY